MREYTFVVIIKSDVKKERKDALMQDVQKWIGEVESPKIESLGDRKLAYPIKKQKTGEYVTLSFAAKTIPTDVNAKMLLQEDVLRHLLIRN
jgi:small subunit ribosomal protein S6